MKQACHYALRCHVTIAYADGFAADAYADAALFRYATPPMICAEATARPENGRSWRGRGEF